MTRGVAQRHLKYVIMKKIMLLVCSLSLKACHSTGSFCLFHPNTIFPGFCLFCKPQNIIVNGLTKWTYMLVPLFSLWGQTIAAGLVNEAQWGNNMLNSTLNSQLWKGYGENIMTSNRILRRTESERLAHNLFWWGLYHVLTLSSKIWME